MRILSGSRLVVPSSCHSQFPSEAGPDSDSGPQLVELGWREAMKRAVRDPHELCHLLQLPPALGVAAAAAAGPFPLFVPREFLAKITPGDVADPLLRQVLPLAAENQIVDGYSVDPVGDLPASPQPGLVHKYQGRALLITTGTCAVHCRYCFRRHFPYQETPRGVEAWRPALAALAADPSIEEVLLSGGDPLTLVDHQLSCLLRELADVKHVRRVRIHTRLPIMIPQRVTPSLLETLRATRLVPILVVHANHPRELDRAVLESLGQIVDGGIPVLNQSVLLRGVNDELQILVELSRRLIDARVMPYYLHRLDQVAGAAHFDVSASRGIELIGQMRQLLPGYAVPRFVAENAGERSKHVLA